MPSAKSELIRAVLLGSLAQAKTEIAGGSLCADVIAAIAAVEQCGIKVERLAGGSMIVHGGRWQRAEVLSAGESAFLMRTLPFLVSFQGLVGCVQGEGTLLNRPQHALDAVMRGVGMLYAWREGALQFSYLLPKRPYAFALPHLGSSQPLSGVLMAAPLVGETVRVRVDGVKSSGYVSMTLAMMARFGVEVQHPEEGVYVVPSGQEYRASSAPVGGDWSAAAIFIAAAAHGGCIVIQNLEKDSLQPDRAVLRVLDMAEVVYGWEADGSLRVDGSRKRPKSFTFDATDCPDLVPALVLLASMARGKSRIVGAGRLRGKESDRASMLEEGFRALGGRVRVEGDALLVEGVDVMQGGVTVLSRGDHRMAMVFGAAGTLCSDGVRVEGKETVKKSYVDFWSDLRALQRVV